MLPTSLYTVNYNNVLRMLLKLRLRLIHLITQTFFSLFAFSPLTFYEICNLYQSAEVNSNTKIQLNVQTVQYSQIRNFSTFSKYCHLNIWFKLTISKPNRQINVMLMCTIYQYITVLY
jgi:hypothetical protein